MAATSPSTGGAGQLKIDPKLKDYATKLQAKYIDLINEHGTAVKAAQSLGIDPSGVARAVHAVRKKAAAQGYAPEHDLTNPVPVGFSVRGVSTLYKQDGTVAAQWVKSRAEDEQREEAMKAAAEALAQDIPRVEPLAAPEMTIDILCNLYVLTDCHVGALAWRKEGGADWDLNIAEKTLVGCFSQMVAKAPEATTGVIAQLGDWMHFDGLEAVTPTNRHLLDADGRFSKVVASAIRILRAMVDMALRKHQKVVVLMAEGNHDLSSSVWLRHMFAALYENEPRVEVIDSELPYYAYQHGQVMLAFHHGHLKKNDALPILFAAQYPAMWGRTNKRYAHSGHRHHVEEKEHSGMTVVQHPTLAARDAYAARGGWISERQATVTTYHARHGKVATLTVCPEMLD